MLHGVDVQGRYQKDLIASRLDNVDFVITKATGGKNFVINRTYNDDGTLRQNSWEEMLSGAELVGIYHYAKEKGYSGTASEEAANFITQANKRPDAVLFLDWEEDDKNDADWALEWLRLVEAGTGRKPIFYTYYAILKENPALSRIQAAGYQLWYARYLYSAKVGWKDYAAPTAPIWGAPVMWQYSSAGGIAGYAGALDLNIFYGDATDWRSLAAHTQKEETMTADADRKGVVATIRSLRWVLYSNAFVGATVAQIKARGKADCSDVSQAGFGAHGYVIGPMSYQQALDGVEVASYRGPASGSVAAFNKIKDRIKTADIICMAIDPARPGKVSHVETFTETIPVTIGHGSGTGPKEQDVRASWLLGKATFWTVRRIIPDDKTTTTTESTTTTLTNIEEVVAAMKATQIIFQFKNTIYIADVLAGTYRAMKNPKTFSDTVTFLKRCGAKVVEWKYLAASKSNVVDNPSAFGIEVK